MRVVLDARKHEDFGIGTYIRGLTDGLLECSADVDLQLLGVPPGRGTAESEQQRTRSSHATWSGGQHYPWTHDGSSLYGIAELVTVSRAARRLQADVLHAPHYVFPLLSPCPVVVTVHDCIHLRFPEQLPHRGALLYARAMLRRAVRGASAVIAVSEATRGDLVSLLGADPDRVTVVHNGCDPYFLEEPEPGEVDSVLHDLQLPDRFVLHVGNPKPHKNIEGLVDAFAALKSGPDLGLVQVGARHGASADLQRHVAASGRGDRIRLLGFTSRQTLRALYHRCSVFAFPSLYEGFGLPPLEAMACGAPVVAANTGAIPEVVGEAGVLVDPREKGELADALSRMLDDAKLRGELGFRGPLRAAGFRWADTASRTMDVYREVST